MLRVSPCHRGGGDGDDTTETKAVGSPRAGGHLNGDDGEDHSSRIGNTELTFGPGYAFINGGHDTDTCQAQATGKAEIKNCP